jgi:hypothetical protein
MSCRKSLVTCYVELVLYHVALYQVLREVLKCSLPVELVWHTVEEMDAATLAALRQHFGPIVGVNLSGVPWPAHHRAKELVQ